MFGEDPVPALPRKEHNFFAGVGLLVCSFLLGCAALGLVVAAGNGFNIMMRYLFP